MLTKRKWSPDPEKCQAVVSEGWPPGQCSRKGVVEEDGKLWCRQHTPSAVKKRLSETEKRWEAKFEERRRRDRDRAWNMVIREIQKLNPKLAEEVRKMAVNDEQTT